MFTRMFKFTINSSYLGSICRCTDREHNDLASIVFVSLNCPSDYLLSSESVRDDANT